MPSNKASNLRRWGLTWIVIGFFSLLTELFGIDNWLWTTLTMLLVILVSPSSNAQIHWLRRTIAFVGGMGTLAVVVIGIIWLGEKMGFEPAFGFAAISLLIGIVLQVWGEMSLQSQITQEAFGPLIEKIKKL
jgi:apolipoprotein N-acyltransferase